MNSRRRRYQLDGINPTDHPEIELVGWSHGYGLGYLRVQDGKGVFVGTLNSGSAKRLAHGILAMLKEGRLR